MTTHVHFHDFLQSDRKPFEEAKHKRSHGRFATMAGPGAQQVNPGLRETKPPTRSVHARPKPQPQPQSRLATWGKQAQEVKAGAAARVARAVQTAKSQGAGLAQEAFTIPHDVDTLTKGFSSPNTPMRVKLGQALAKNIPNYLKEMAKENVDLVRGVGSSLWTAANGRPFSDRETEAWKAVGRKVALRILMTAAGVPPVPGSAALAEGAAHAIGHVAGHILDHVTQHILEHVTEEVVDHATEEHTLKLSGGVGRALRHVVRGRSAQGGHHDRAFRDGPTDQQCMQALNDYLQTVAKSLASAPIDMKKILASAPKQNGDSGRFGPMFGGLKSSGNRLTGDEGTSEGAKKGWANRGRTSTVVEPPELRKTTPSTRPTFAEMKAQTEVFPEKKERNTPKPSPRNPRKAETPEGVQRDPVVVMPKKGQAPASTGYKTQQSFFSQGKKRSPESRGKKAGSLPLGQNISMTQREREGPARERQATTAARQREELKSLQARHAKGELSDKEKEHMNRLLREHGGGGGGAVTRAGTPGPPKRFLRTQGGRRWLTRKR
jgi:hypothetical protein